MSGMTEFVRHPRKELAGFYLKKAMMDSQLKMSGMKERARVEAPCLRLQGHVQLLSGRTDGGGIYTAVPGCFLLLREGEHFLIQTQA